MQGDASGRGFREMGMSLSSEILFIYTFTCIHACIENDASMAPSVLVYAAGIAKSSRNSSAFLCLQECKWNYRTRYIQSASGGRLVIFRH